MVFGKITVSRRGMTGIREADLAALDDFLGIRTEIMEKQTLSL
jgi:hypothetical protein